MKCQNCGVNYEDDERECPMCGTRAGARGRMSVPWYTDETHKTHSKDTCTHQTYTQKYTGMRTAPPAARPRQPKKAAGVLLTIVIALSALLPAAFELISDHAYDISHWAQSLPEGGTSVDIPSAPAEDVSDNLIWANSVFGAGGVISLPDGGEYTLSIDEDDAYTLARSDGQYTERGEAWCWWNDPEDELYPWSSDFPAEEYDSFTVCFEISGTERGGEHPERDAVDAHAEMGEMWLLVHFSKESGEIVLENWYGDGAFLFGEETYLPYSSVQAS